MALRHCRDWVVSPGVAPDRIITRRLLAPLLAAFSVMPTNPTREATRVPRAQTLRPLRDAVADLFVDAGTAPHAHATYLVEGTLLYSSFSARGLGSSPGPTALVMCDFVDFSGGALGSSPIPAAAVIFSFVDHSRVT